MPLFTVDCADDECPQYATAWCAPKEKHQDRIWDEWGDARLRKADCACWPYVAKRQYAGAKRGLRVIRWHHRLQRDRVEHLFRTYVEQWKCDTQHWSSVTKMLAHRSYLNIVALSRIAKPNQLARLLLEELQNDPDHWFDALEVITGQNPVQPDMDFDQAVEAWVQWGKDNGVLAD